MPTQTTLADALTEAGLEAEAAQRWARAIEKEQSAAAQQTSAEQQSRPRHRLLDSERLYRFVERTLPIVIGICVLEFVAAYMTLGYFIGRLLEG